MGVKDNGRARAPTRRGSWRIAGLAVLTLVLASCGGRDGPPPVVGTTGIDRWHREIAVAADRFDVPEVWIRAVMARESSGRTHFADGRPLVSRAGAVGLMQVLPSTYRELRRKHGLGRDPHDPQDNVLAGTAYIRQMYDRFGNPGFLAAYNAGPGRYARYLAGEASLPAETRAYLRAVAPLVAGIQPGDRKPDRPVAAARAEPPAVSTPHPRRSSETRDPAALEALIRSLPADLTTVEIRQRYAHLFD